MRAAKYRDRTSSAGRRKKWPRTSIRASSSSSMRCRNRPPAKCSGACCKSRKTAGGRALSAGPAELIAHHPAEPLPALAVEALHLHRLDRSVVVVAGRDGDPRQQRIDVLAFHRGGLLHHVFARQVVAALLQYLLEGARHGVAVYIRAVVQIARWVVLLHEAVPPLHRRVVRPLLVAVILEIGGGDDAHRLFQSCRREHRADRRRDVIEILHRLPADVVGLADRLRREFWSAHIEENVGT